MVGPNFGSTVSLDYIPELDDDALDTPQRASKPRGAWISVDEDEGEYFDAEGNSEDVQGGKSVGTGSTKRLSSRSSSSGGGGSQNASGMSGSLSSNGNDASNTVASNVRTASGDGAGGNSALSSVSSSAAKGAGIGKNDGFNTIGSAAQSGGSNDTSISVAGGNTNQNPLSHTDTRLILADDPSLYEPYPRFDVYSNILLKCVL